MNTIIWVIKADITSVLWFCKDTFEYFLFLSCPLNEHFDVNEQLLKVAFGFGIDHSLILEIQFV